MKFGRSDDEWDELATAGLGYLIEHARQRVFTTYTELNHELVRRTGLKGFDFSLESDRAAVGHLLWLIVERNRPETGFMISALVRYLNGNGAGPGFYNLAADYGLLPRNASAEAKDEFWHRQYTGIHDHYTAQGTRADRP